MSIYDPIEERRRRRAARHGSKPSAVMLVIGWVVALVGGVLELRSIYGFAGVTGDADQPTSAIVFQVIGLPAILLGLFLSFTGASRYTGRLLAVPFVSPLTIMFAGFAVGAWWGLSDLGDPDLVLSTLPPVLSALTALMLLAGIRARLRRRARRGALEELVVTGRIVPGLITDIPEGDPNADGLIGPVTVRFTDSAGVDRWVQKVGQWRRTELPKTGDPAAVLFDPGDPGNTGHTWVGPLGSVTAADFSRWHS
ncbi:MAG: hypothetical protein QM638_22425 [Nocardioides sp.]|uniref:hypothetical protein n=1 Tax=Nocardioides sp. TaxID=35761 RepID=UPI0039E6C90E